MATALTGTRKSLAVHSRVLRLLLTSLFVITGLVSCRSPDAERLVRKPPERATAAGIAAEAFSRPTPTSANFAPPEPAPLSEDAQVVAVLNAYNSAHQAGNAEEAFAHLAPLHVVQGYEPDCGYCAYYFHGFSSSEELAPVIEKSVSEHGKLSTWRVDEIDYSHQPRRGGGYDLVFADVWRTYDDGYVGKFTFLLVKHEGRYLIIGMHEMSY